MTRLWLAGLTVLLACTAPARAQTPAPGAFDFFVLALSWSPAYCAGPRASPQQCEGPLAHRFVVHGLWPQYERGYPEHCARKAPFVPEPVVQSMSDLMPSKGLVLHEWRKHGTCTGLAPAAYFALVRSAFERVRLPDMFRVGAPLPQSGEEIERAFMAANPGLAPDMVAVACAKGDLTEVRICLSKDLAFRSCPEIDRRACRTSGKLEIRAPRDG